MRRLKVWRFYRWPNGDFDTYLTGYVYISSHAYAGEKKWYVRIGEWRKNFGRKVKSA